MLKEKLNTKTIFFLLLLVTCVFLRFYEIEKRNPFGWDQVDNAWAAKKIIIDHQFSLRGMVAKENTGFYIGPAYYYLISFFYFIFNLDPIASGVFAGLTSLVYFLVLFYITRKLFSLEVALVALFLNTVSFSAISFDRVQWPVNFIPIISLIIFYCLYKITMGEEKYLIPLSLVLGFSFHIHFTSVFYPIIIILALPFFPKTTQLVKYGLASLPLFLLWFAPHLISELQTKSTQARNLANYLNTYYHGLHLVRVLQLAKDAFIRFEGFFFWPVIKPLKYILFPLFSVVYFLAKPSRERFLLCYLMGLWFVVPWIVFATYSGEISDYYFSLSRPIVLLIISYLLWRLLRYQNFALRGLVILFLLCYSMININRFMRATPRALGYYEKIVKEKIKNNERINFQEGVPDSYLYYYYMRQKGEEVY